MLRGWTTRGDTGSSDSSVGSLSMWFVPGPVCHGQRSTEGSLMFNRSLPIRIHWCFSVYQDTERHTIFWIFMKYPSPDIIRHTKPVVHHIHHTCHTTAAAAAAPRSDVYQTPPVKPRTSSASAAAAVGLRSYQADNDDDSQNQEAHTYTRAYMISHFFFFFSSSGGRGKIKLVQAHHTSTYFHTRRVSI